MNNAEKFKSVFGLYATELWAMSEESFLSWLNSENDEMKKDNRLIPKEPIFKTGESLVHVNRGDQPHEWRNNTWAEWCCPTCGWFVGEQYVPRKHNQKKSNYCSKCGQAIDWDAVEPEKFALHEKERKELKEVRKKVLIEEMERWNQSA